MKTYLLIAGEHFYPSADTGDWVGCFSTYEEAKAQGHLKTGVLCGMILL